MCVRVCVCVCVCVCVYVCMLDGVCEITLSPKIVLMPVFLWLSQ